MKRNELIEEILQLDDVDRRYISDVVMASLGGDDEPQLTAEEQATILRRLEAYRSHPETFLSWDELKAKLHQHRLERGQR